MVVGRSFLAVWACRTVAVAALLAAPAVGHGQMDLNQLFSKVTSLGPAGATTTNDPPPDPSQFREPSYQPKRYGNSRYSYRSSAPRYGSVPNGDVPHSDDAQTDQELAELDEQSPYSTSPRPSSMRTAMPDAPQTPRPMNGSRSAMSGQRGMVGPSGLSARASMNNPSMNAYQCAGSPRVYKNSSAEMIATPGGPVVMPDAVYLDGTMQSVMSPDDGSMPEGMMQGPMYGGPTMEGGPAMGPPMYGSRGPDGFTNPYCNDCDSCGGGCNSCGPGGCNSCGRGGGWRGDCLDCGGGCGNRPSCWLLAPCDWFRGGMWHQGPYCGPCAPCANWWWGQDFTVFGGAQAFQSPVDLGIGSNHGFNEGFNWSMPLWRARSIGAQFGLRFTQNNFGDTRLDDSTRTQTFLTTGLFHRPPCNQGAQYGLVFDWLHDDYYQTFSVAQLRGELSWLCDCVNEVGFFFAAGVHNDHVRDQFQNQTFFATYEPIDQYAFFYRRRFCGGGEGRLWGGFTNEVNGGLFGADFRVPLAPQWSLDGGFNYLFASSNQNELFTNDAWNVGVNLVWNFGGNACGGCGACGNTRPLFNVADNGSFMVTRHGLVPNLQPLGLQ